MVRSSAFGFRSSGIRHWLSTPDPAWCHRVLADVRLPLQPTDRGASYRKEPAPVVEQAMIQPLRVVHRRAFVALALVLPAILLIGLGARRPGLDPRARPIDAPDTGKIVRESSNLWQKHSIQSRFYRNPDGALDTYVVLLPAEELNEPDLLLYWAKRAAGKRSACGCATSGRIYLGQGLCSRGETCRPLGLVQPGSSDCA